MLTMSPIGLFDPVSLEIVDDVSSSSLPFSGLAKRKKTLIIKTIQYQVSTLKLRETAVAIVTSASKIM